MNELNELLEFLAEKPARVSYGDRWLCVTSDGNEVTYTVYQRTFGQRKTRTLYDGSTLATAIKWLSGDLS